MSQTMYVAASGALVHQMRLEVLTNNLANINTVGFKEDRSSFRTFLPASSVAAKGSAEGALISGGRGVTGQQRANVYVSFAGTRTSFSQGELRNTGNPTDLALDGKGFFSIETPDGTQYTRKGNFTLNQDGVLVTQEGLPVLGESGRISVGNRTFNVDQEGNIWVDGNQMGTLKIVDFPQPRALEKVGNTMFTLKDPGVGENRAEGVKVRQGFVELSNVGVIRMMAEMIEVLRAYESYQKVIHAISEANSKTVNEVGRLA